MKKMGGGVNVVNKEQTSKQIEIDYLAYGIFDFLLPGIVSELNNLCNPATSTHQRCIELRVRSHSSGVCLCSVYVNTTAQYISRTNIEVCVRKMPKLPGSSWSVVWFVGRWTIVFLSFSVSASSETGQTHSFSMRIKSHIIKFLLPSNVRILWAWSPYVSLISSFSIYPALYQYPL